MQKWQNIKYLRAWSVHTEISAFNLPIKDNPFDKFDDAATYQIFFLQQQKFTQFFLLDL